MSAVATLPALSVEVGGAPLAKEDARALVEVRVTQRLSLPTLCELRFAEPTGRIGRGSPNPVGLSLSVVAEGAAPLFAGEITAVEHVHTPSRGHEVSIRGYDLLHRLRRRQPLRAFEHQSLGSLASALAGELGISAEVAEDGSTFARILQHGQTDLELLAEVAEQCGQYFALHDGVLHVFTLRGLGDPIPLLLGDSLLEAHCEVNADPACSGVKTTGWDPFRVVIHEGTAGEPRVGREVFAEIPSDSVEAEGRRRVHEAVQDERQAAALAQGELDRRFAASVTLWGVAKGRPELRPGSRLQVTGVVPSFEGRHVVTSATHVIDPDKGFVTEFGTEPPPPLPRRRGATVVPGIVRSVEDPEGLGRVKLTLPACGDLETEWLSVMMPAAGPGKGIVALPDVGDRVLVQCAQEDPDQGLVLGGLFSTKGPPDAGVEKDRVRRFTFLTPGGQKIQLDDDKERIRLENGAGSFLDLTKKEAVLHCGVDLTIRAPGKAVVIAGKSIDFRSA